MKRVAMSLGACALLVGLAIFLGGEQNLGAQGIDQGLTVVRVYASASEPLTTSLLGESAEGAVPPSFNVQEINVMVHAREAEHGYVYLETFQSAGPPGAKPYTKIYFFPLTFVGNTDSLCGGGCDTLVLHEKLSAIHTADHPILVAVHLDETEPGAELVSFQASVTGN